jgi:DNA-binding beta-propeller fold protein YncE
VLCRQKPLAEPVIMRTAVLVCREANGMFAYVTVGGVNEVQVYRTNDFSKVATIPVGKLPHGIWPSGDGTRVYVGLENEDRIAAIDTLGDDSRPCRRKGSPAPATRAVSARRWGAKVSGGSQ